METGLTLESDRKNRQKCSTSHGPGSQGSCDQSTSPPLCTCYYNCPSPPQPPPSPKMCNRCEGLCNNVCTDQCCSDRCAAKFNQG
ncbi:hypothetical protein EUGRSUZ_L01934 [Eucalyptus grandis]|uniref:Defensin-like protein n=1 Tax=Eucalyptus grandis TaxID=71139 RepID=A0A058ZSZ2_EUCGR|nr:hypothetical protein EUGRSUZ_L01934 [Eucalyptus grandis]